MNECVCGEPAMARLIFVEADGTEKGRSEVKCKQHYWEALDLWGNFTTVLPEAVSGLRVLVQGPE